MSILFNIKKNDIKKISSCAICNHKSFKIISEIFFKNKFVFFRTVSCKNCSFIFRDIHPSNKWFNKQYKKRSSFQSKKKVGINFNYEKLRIFRYQQLYNFLENKIKFKNVLDIGCATGLGLNVFKKKEKNIMGIDTDKTRINYGLKKNLNLKNVNIFDFKCKKKFDLIIFLHTLEHLTSPNQAIKKILSLMNEKSNLYLEVPNFKNLVRSWDDSIYLSHLSNFTEENLEYFLTKHNLQILYKTYPQTENGEYNLGVLCKKKVNSYKKRINKFKKIKLDAYQINGKNPKLPLGYRINLDYINDLSFAWKLNFENNAKLNDNFKRLLKYDYNINKFIIDKKTFNFKDKKNKFLKNLKNLRYSS